MAAKATANFLLFCQHSAGSKARVHKHMGLQALGSPCHQLSAHGATSGAAFLLAQLPLTAVLQLTRQA